MTTAQELQSFTRFATHKLDADGSSLSMEELFDLWRAEHPSPERKAEDLEAVQAAIKDLETGDRGIPAEEHSREVREKFNLPPSE